MTTIVVIRRQRVNASLNLFLPPAKSLIVFGKCFLGNKHLFDISSSLLQVRTNQKFAV